MQVSKLLPIFPAINDGQCHMLRSICGGFPTSLSFGPMIRCRFRRDLWISRDAYFDYGPLLIVIGWNIPNGPGSNLREKSTRCPMVRTAFLYDCLTGTFRSPAGGGT